jgi:hypothetical protein
MELSIETIIIILFVLVFFGYLTANNAFLNPFTPYPQAQYYYSQYQQGQLPVQQGQQPYYYGQPRPVPSAVY